MAYSLRLVEDRLEAGAAWPAPLPPLYRVFYVLQGEIMVDGEGGAVRIGADRAALAVGRARAEAGPLGAHVLRWELVPQPPPPSNGGRVLLEHPIALDPRARWLVRCERVDFEPDGVALPHRHRGGGIRCLLAGGLEVTVGGGAPQHLRPGDAWFESGREPVRARAGAGAAAFVRVCVLPEEVRGRSSLVYVDPADAGRSRPRAYTVFVDAPIAL
jgi:quercetin dioxygenase-like cupin family protein